MSYISPTLDWELLPQFPPETERRSKEHQYTYFFTSRLVISDLVERTLSPVIVQAILSHVQALAEQENGISCYQVFKHRPTEKMILLVDGMNAYTRLTVPHEVENHDFVSIHMFSEYYESWGDYWQ